MDASGWIDLVLARAPELRKAGVLAIGFEGCTATLESAPPVYATDDAKADATKEPRGVMDDPASYIDGQVPGYKIYNLDGTERT